MNKEDLFCKIATPRAIIETWWTETLKKVRNSIVFLDDVVAESLHWCGGLMRLKKAGAKDVREFSSFEHCPSNYEKAVFIISSILDDLCLDKLKEIIANGKLKYVILITCSHPSVSVYALGDEEKSSSFMDHLEEKILDWMGNKNYTAEIFHYSLTLVPLTDDVFLIPRFSSLIPFFNDDISNAFNKSSQSSSIGERSEVLNKLSEFDIANFPLNFRVEVRNFVVTFHTLFQAMDAREEIFSLGSTAKLIASELETFNPARIRRRSASNKVSLVIVDRSLDLVAPTSYNGDSLLSRILNLLPRLHGHTVDSAISLSPLSKLHKSSSWTLASGSFCPRDEHSSQLFDSMVRCSQKEVLNRLITKLSLIYGDDKSSNLKNDNICAFLSELAEQSDVLLKYFSFMQQSLGICQCLNDPKSIQLDRLYSIEKNFLLAAEMDEPPLGQIVQLLKTRQNNSITLLEIMSLLIHVASLGNVDGQTEYEVINALSNALVEEGNCNDGENISSLEEIVGGSIDEMSALKASKRIWNRLVEISQNRNHLKEYRNIVGRKSDYEPYVYKPLVCQLVEDCLKGSETKLKDLDYKSQGFKDIIKTGFSLFVNVSHPKPTDVQTMFVYVIGGISPTEISQILSIVKREKPRCDVIVSSSHLIDPQNCVLNSLRAHKLFED